MRPATGLVVLIVQRAVLVADRARASLPAGRTVRLGALARLLAGFRTRLAPGRITMGPEPRPIDGRVDRAAGHGRRVAAGGQFGLRRLSGDTRAQRGLTGASGGNRTAQRRLRQRPAHRPDAASRWRRGVLQLGELTAEVGDGGVRSVLDPRPEHRRDEDCEPCGGDDQEDELSHKKCGVICRAFKNGGTDLPVASMTSL